MHKTKKLIIAGDSAFAEVAYEYFTHDSAYEVVGFTVEEAFLERDRLFDLPVVPMERVTDFYDPARTHFYAAVVYSQLNRLRARLYAVLKAKGFEPASYVSSRCFIWPNVTIGEHVFIFEDNTIQPFSRIGNNVVLWSGNHIGHHSIVGDHCFVSSHVVISGFCNVGSHSFLGVNSTLGNNVDLGEDNWLGPSVTLTRSTEPNSLFKIDSPEPAKVSARRFFKVKESA
jgi:sugar O-acyltransferase (sialic acid O-acetyltransferase NeuD family)